MEYYSNTVYYLKRKSADELRPFAVLVKGRFRKRSLYLLIDLAIADLLVGLFAVPIYMITVISEDKFMPRVVFDSVDMFTGLSSIFTLTVISLERLFAISRL